MRQLLLFALGCVSAGTVYGQMPGLTLPPSGNNQRASVTQYIGPVAVTVEYSSPAVRGPNGKDRRGEIWGKLVPYGMSDLGFGKPAPWRAGANQNTVLAVSDDVMLEDKPLAAGRYGVHMIPGQEEWTLVVSKNASGWGSYFYDESEDVLRVKVKPHKHEYREWLAYDFTVRRPSEATVELQWEDLAVPWTIKVPNINELYVSRLRRDLSGALGFDYRAYVAAAEFCAQTNTNLEQGLKWADAAISLPFAGQENFQTLSTKALLLSKLGRDGEAATLMKTALRHPTATPIDIHQYGRQLLAAKKNAEALEVFKLNAERNGDAWPVHVGLARGYAAVGDNAQALEHARKAVTQAPDAGNRQNLERMVTALSAGKPIDP